MPNNNNKRVLLFTFISFSLLLITSIASNYLAVYWPFIKNIDILSDIKLSQVNYSKQQTFTKKQSGDGIDSLAYTTTIKTDSISFNQYLLPGRFVDFRSDTTQPVLPKFVNKLAALKRGERIKIRIAWFGDSLIEGDLITQTVRELLQNEFAGNHGVGFVPFKSITAGFRTSATALTTGSWIDDNFKSKVYNDPLFFSGHVFYSSGGQFKLRDNTVKDSVQVLEKWLVCGSADSNTAIFVNKIKKTIAANSIFNRILIDKSKNNSFELTVPNRRVALYGVSSEPESGVIIDNLSYRGISGFELGKFDEKFLVDISKNSVYDLIVIQYGVNMMFRAKDTNYEYYKKGMDPVLKRIKYYLPNTDFLMVSCTDRAFRYGSEWKTAIGLDSLLKTQATLAFNNKIPFFNLYTTMGGNGTIVNWASGPIRYASKDYIHASPKGALLLGKYFFNAFMIDYKKRQLKKAEK